MRTTMSLRWVVILIAVAAALSGCASKRAQQDADNAPTLKTLSGREIDVPEDKGIQADVGDAIAMRVPRCGRRTQ